MQTSRNYHFRIGFTELCQNVRVQEKQYHERWLIESGEQLTIGGGPHMRIAVSSPGGGRCSLIITSLMKPVSHMFPRNTVAIANCYKPKTVHSYRTPSKLPSVSRPVHGVEHLEAVRVLCGQLIELFPAENIIVRTATVSLKSVCDRHQDYRLPAQNVLLRLVSEQQR